MTSRSAAVSSPASGPTGQTFLLVRIGDHGELLDVEQVLIEGAGRGGTEQTGGLSRCGHAVIDNPGRG